MRMSRNSKVRDTQSGYALLMAVFLVATLLVLSAAAAPNVLTQGRREREEETIWRGKQYKRAIALYFRKFGHYPAEVDDLTKLTDGVRFLRKAYTDPNNKEDGSWRFIYMGPNGQLIGSERSPSVLSSAGAANAGVDLEARIRAIRASYGEAPDGPTGQQPGDTLTPSPPQTQPQPLQGAVLGGNLVGVGSKVKKPSLRVYEGADTYDKWEFIAYPLQQAMVIPGQQLANPSGVPAPQSTLPSAAQMPPALPPQGHP